jgi:integrase/recombinase XerD
LKTFENNVLRTETLHLGAKMKQAKTLTDKQVKVVLAHCATRRHPARDRAIVLFSHLAGLRAKEIAMLTIDNVLADQGIRDEFVLSAAQTKGRKARRVFVSTRLRAELAAFLKHAKLRKGCPALFQSQKGAAFSANTMCQLLIRIYEDCGLEGATSHSGRRTFITNLAAKGVGVRVLAELAAHASIATTQRYIDVNDEQMRAAVELA